MRRHVGVQCRQVERPERLSTYASPFYENGVIFAEISGRGSTLLADAGTWQHSMTAPSAFEFVDASSRLQLTAPHAHRRRRRRDAHLHTLMMIEARFCRDSLGFRAVIYVIDISMAAAFDIRDHLFVIGVLSVPRCRAEG